MGLGIAFTEHLLAEDFHLSLIVNILSCILRKHPWHTYWSLSIHFSDGWIALTYFYYFYLSEMHSPLTSCHFSLKLWIKNNMGSFPWSCWLTIIWEAFLFPVSGLRWPQKRVCYSLDPENSTKSCKSRGSNLHIHFKNAHETAQAIKCMHTRRPTISLKDVTLKSKVCHSIVTVVELVGVHRPHSGAGPRVGGPKRVLNFYCTCSKMQRVMLNLRA